MNCKQPLLKALEPFRYSQPGRDLHIGGNDKREGALHGGESIDYLHQTAQPDLLRKIARSDDHHWKNDRYLRVAGSKPGKAFLPLHDLPKVIEYASEPIVESAEFDWFATVESNALCVFSQAYHTEPKISFEALPGEIERYQRPADFDGEPGADTGIGQARPYQIGRYIDLAPRSDWDLRGSGESPENYKKGSQGNDRSQKPERQAQYISGELVDVFGDALVRVVRSGRISPRRSGRAHQL